MTRRIAWLAGAFLLLAGFSGCADRPADKNATPAASATAEKVYDCPMHPEVRQSTPGKCPKCGMNLVEVVEAGGAGHDHAAGDHNHGPGAAHTDHNPKHGGMLVMQGDYHFELAAHHGGRMEVYVYDAWTKPLSVAKGTAKVTLEMPAAAGAAAPPVTVDLEPLADGTAFHGNSPDADRALAATVEVTLPDTSLSMTFPLQATLSGEIVDIDCYARLGEAGRGSIHAECAAECIRNGMPVGLSVGKSVYVLTLAGSGTDRAANERLAALAGQQVEVTGRVREANGLKMIELADVKAVAEGS